MRIDLWELGKKINKQDLAKELKTLNEKYGFDLSLDLWDSFIDEMTPVKERQMTFFG